MPAPMLTTVVIVSALAAMADCFQWKESLGEFAFVAACVGGNVSLPWTFAPNSNETVPAIKWNFHSTNGQKNLIATYIADNFIPMPAFSQRVQRVTNGGLLLDRVTLSDNGNYSVEVAVRESGGTFRDYKRTAFVEVSDGLRVRVEPEAAYNPGTGQWHLTLSCGIVISSDQSPDHIVWQMPTGVLPSTQYKDGHFYLQVENPVRGGNYSCDLAPNSTASVCLPLSYQQQAAVTVDETNARLRLLEAENVHLKQRVKATETELKNLKDLVQGMLNTTYAPRETARRRVSFFARLSGDTSVSADSRITLPRIMTNQGHAYDSSTGVFTAPYSGTYFLAFTAGYIGEGQAVCVNVMVGNEGKCFTCAHGTHGTWDTSPCTFTVNLSAGERVWAKSYYTTKLNGHSTAFTGFLISSDN